MCARTTKNTHWSEWVEPQTTTPPSDDAITYPLRQPAWVREMVPMFPIKALDDQSVCPHKGPIKRDSVFVCMICHQSGMDHDPALKRSPLTDPKPEPEPTAIPLTAPGKHDGSRKSEQWAPYSKSKGQSAA